ncbi:hypothetical protein PR048_006489 [Dryococelus australis]|uniref:PiggyBac transposable element-derived protein domain-containing protein n=1 Tax=Dryococelus australis TaxID=614101 RepID=A0ABQ9IDC8_9NEOP|nr:hypothetical protein PR048_006489 [Dryococelus australis]
MTKWTNDAATKQQHGRHHAGSSSTGAFGGGRCHPVMTLAVRATSIGQKNVMSDLALKTLSLWKNFTDCSTACDWSVIVRKYLMRQQKTVAIKQIQKYMFLARKTKMNHLPIMTYSFDITRMCCLAESTTNPPATSRTHAHNLVTKLPGLAGDARVHKPKTPSESWRFFIDREIIECVLHNTNKKITVLSSKYGSKNLDCQYTQHTYIPELEAFFGLLHLAGDFKSNQEDTCSLFATERIGRDIFRATMSKNRYIFLLAALRFDDPSTRDERKENDPLSGISQRDMCDITMRVKRSRLGQLDVGPGQITVVWIGTLDLNIGCVVGLLTYLFTLNIGSVLFPQEIQGSMADWCYSPFHSPIKNGYLTNRFRAR